METIMTDLGLMKNSKSTRIPAKTDGPLRKSSDAKPFDEAFHYRSVIGKLNFLEESTRPDIALAVHQCARFSVDPRKPHGEAVKNIGRYLAGTKDKGLIFKPDENAQFEC